MADRGRRKAAACVTRRGFECRFNIVSVHCRWDEVEKRVTRMLCCTTDSGMFLHQRSQGRCQCLQGWKWTRRQPREFTWKVEIQWHGWGGVNRDGRQMSVSLVNISRARCFTCRDTLYVLNPRALIISIVDLHLFRAMVVSLHRSGSAT